MNSNLYDGHVVQTNFYHSCLEDQIHDNLMQMIMCSKNANQLFSSSNLSKTLSTTCTSNHQNQQSTLKIDDVFEGGDEQECFIFPDPSLFDNIISNSMELCKPPPLVSLETYRILKDKEMEEKKYLNIMIEGEDLEDVEEDYIDIQDPYSFKFPHPSLYYNNDRDNRYIPNASFKFESDILDHDYVNSSMENSNYNYQVDHDLGINILFEDNDTMDYDASFKFPDPTIFDAYIDPMVLNSILPSRPPTPPPIPPPVKVIRRNTFNNYRNVNRIPQKLVNNNNNINVNNNINRVHNNKYISVNTTNSGIFDKEKEVAFECSICWDDCYETYSFPYCKHQYCLSCVKSHLTEQVWKTKGANLSCPYPKCVSQTSVHDFQLIVDKNVYDKYMLFAQIRNRTFGDQKVVFCLNCEFPLVVETKEQLEIQCDNDQCKAEMCIECGTFVHPGINCQINKENIYNSMSPEERETIKVFEKEQYKECPQCKTFVFKEDGCECVNCLSCGHQFCYYCLEPHDHNLATHVHGPRYIAPLIDTYRPNREHGRKKRIFKQAMKLVGYTALCIVGAGPVLAAGAVFVLGYSVAYPFIQLRKHLKASKNRSFRKWCQQEIKRREELGLPVSDYIRQASIKKKK
ncbi:hypothetical protein DLAC_01565 [Tieghemostelium lacteum]|uniref:RING-type domain-containing protein n=1 Tax=Tieghemostelium lacteum TaxID=361077 RepID=A0A152A5S2_TIELA|nr:hypothetical protein DLAC_01565 [Tieghemostelium lacteum]|eukprot:KYR01570.1 hypothetical protein DLAC_01565 [Tieghemostelium lacteum]